ncbi:hypothetical protein ACCS72_38695, partial [Rhizobium ruizarguesonis]
SSEIFDQAGELTDVGAGFQVSPNASRILAEFIILEGLSKVWLEPDAIRLISGSSLRQLAETRRLIFGNGKAIGDIAG